MPKSILGTDEGTEQEAEPNNYIRDVGHDRCPIILTEREFMHWPEISNPVAAKDFLLKNRDYNFTHQWEDPLFTIAQQVKVGKIGE